MTILYRLYSNIVCIVQQFWQAQSDLHCIDMLICEQGSPLLFVKVGDVTSNTTGYWYFFHM